MAARRPAGSRPEYWIAAAAFFLRVAVLIIRPSDHHAEMSRMAETLALQGFLGNPYPFPTGVSAHVAPAYPTILAAFRLLSGSTAGMTLLGGLLSASLAAVLVAVLPRIAQAFTLSRAAGLLAACFLSVPFFAWVELNGVWEAPIAAVLLPIVVAWSYATLHGNAAGTMEAAVLGLGWGVFLLLTPSMLLVLFVILAWSLLIGRRELGRRTRQVCVTMIGVLVVLAPYTVRNYQRLGGLMFVRSNFGLELSISNGPGARATVAENFAADGRMQHHPYVDTSEARRLASIGEVAYNKQRMAEATRWIRDSSARFAGLTAERALLQLVPRLESTPKSVLLAGTTAVFIVACLLLAGRADRIGLLFLGIAAAYSAPYILVQTDVRYMYPLYPLKQLVAAHAGITVWSAIAARYRRSTRGSPSTV